MQGGILPVGGAGQFQVADGKTVHPQIIFAAELLDGSKVLQVGVFGVLEVMQYGAGGNDGGMQVLNAKSLQRMGLELFEQAFGGIGLIEYPAFERIGIKFTAEYFFELFLVAA